MASPSLFSSSGLSWTWVVVIGLAFCCTSYTLALSPSAAASFSSSSSVGLVVASSFCSRWCGGISRIRLFVSYDATSPIIESTTKPTEEEEEKLLFFAQEFGEPRLNNIIDNDSRVSNYDDNNSYEILAEKDTIISPLQQQEYTQQPSSTTTTSSPWQTNDDASSLSTDEASIPLNKNYQQPISNLDARVLESILQEGKLDLRSEAEVKRLLEGPRRREEETNQNREEKDEKYNSKFVSAVTDNAFWNSLKAKATEIIESVGIYIENRIERDAQTLAAVGLFTLDRIRRDVGRALPAAGRATRKLLLATNSSYAEKFLDITDKTPFALPAERSWTDREMTVAGDVYDELSTPADEIRQVTEAISDILSGKRLQVMDSSSYPNYSRRAVRSFAPAGTSKLAERQRRAYQARKQTVLKREKEGIDRKVGRAFGSVTDATWEFRREMQSQVGREAGYRSKGVRNALAAGATRLLEAGRENRRRLSGGKNKNILVSGDLLRDEIASNVIDASPAEEERIIADIIDERKMEYAPDGLLSPQSFLEEKQRLIACLDSCLSQPSETWLTKEVVAQATASGVMLNGTVLRDVIANMVALRNNMQNELEGILTNQVDLNISYIQSDLRQMKQMIDAVASLAISAAGESAAYLLKQELEGFVLSDSLDDIIEIELERMEQNLAEMVASREIAIQYQKQIDFMDSTELDDVSIRRGASTRKRPNNELFTEVEVVSSLDRADFLYGNKVNQGQDVYQVSSTVEVVSESEYSEYERQFKYVQSEVTGKQVDFDENNRENIALDFVLRLVDVVFFIGEKFFLVLPDVILAGAKVFSRYGNAQNRGRGSVGWKPLRNVKRKRNR